MQPERPHVRVEPGVRFGQPHIRGVTTEAVAARVSAGDGPEDVCAELGLSLEELYTALWFEGEHGEYGWWRSWAQLAYGHLTGELPFAEIPEVPDG